MSGSDQTAPQGDVGDEVVGVRFENLPNLCYYDRNHLNVKVGDLVIAETDRGDGLGVLQRDCLESGYPEPRKALGKLIRRATKQDLEQDKERKELEQRAFRICVEKVGAAGLALNLVDVHYYFDRSKAVFYFTADARVDFRELVKNLARQLNIRIEMRQIGVRDKARLVGGMGSCGRELCCKSFLKDFEPVSVRMAKDQNLPLNPTKISGVCGRLMCCLMYEHQTYKCLARELPKCGKKVQLKQGAGKVTRHNPLKGTVVVQLEAGGEVVLKPEEIKS